MRIYICHNLAIFFFQNGIRVHNLLDIQQSIYLNKATTYMVNVFTKRVTFLFVDDFNAVNLKQRINQ